MHIFLPFRSQTVKDREADGPLRGRGKECEGLKLSSICVLLLINALLFMVSLKDALTKHYMSQCLCCSFSLLGTVSTSCNKFTGHAQLVRHIELAISSRNVEISRLYNNEDIFKALYECRINPTHFSFSVHIDSQNFILVIDSN